MFATTTASAAVCQRLAARIALPPSPTHRILPTLARRNLHASQRQCVRVGDAVPDLQLTETSPGNKVNLAEELSTGKGLIIGVPAAFSPSCSASHVPGYISSPHLRNAGKVFVVSVNDAFVMGKWAESLDPEAKSGIRFLADAHATFTNALDVSFASAAVFGQDRSKRYALVTEDGVITAVHIEPDNTGVKDSAAENVLGQ